MHLRIVSSLRSTPGVAGRAGNGLHERRAIVAPRCYTFIMPELRRRALRSGFALVAALSLLASASGIPMCVSIWSQAAPHCPMHGPEKAHQHHADAHSILASLASLSGDGCHPDSAAPDCASGGSCPTGGPVARMAAPGVVFLTPSAPAVPLASNAAFRSHLAPPLSPPPLA